MQAAERSADRMTSEPRTGWKCRSLSSGEGRPGLAGRGPGPGPGPAKAEELAEEGLEAEVEEEEVVVVEELEADEEQQGASWL